MFISTNFKNVGIFKYETESECEEILFNLTDESVDAFSEVCEPLEHRHNTETVWHYLYKSAVGERFQDNIFKIDLPDSK